MEEQSHSAQVILSSSLMGFGSDFATEKNDEEIRSVNCKDYRFCLLLFPMMINDCNLVTCMIVVTDFLLVDCLM